MSQSKVVICKIDHCCVSNPIKEKFKFEMLLEKVFTIYLRGMCFMDVGADVINNF